MPLMDGGARAFTAAADGRMRVLYSPVLIAQAFNPTPGQVMPPAKSYQGVWDTGATGSVITPRVVSECGLVQTGVAVVNHGGGVSHNVPTYLVSVRLPNDVTFPVVAVSALPITSGDVLIGMDIIGVGDFAVSSYDGKTKFTFRLPSLEAIDFVEEMNRQNRASERRVGRNDPCPCGSGRKYKRCCGVVAG